MAQDIAVNVVFILFLSYIKEVYRSYSYCRLCYVRAKNPITSILASKVSAITIDG
jgi:hypothetical protein